MGGVNTLAGAPGLEEMMTDEELVELVLAGEREVFAQLYERYYSRAYRLAYGMTGHRQYDPATGTFTETGRLSVARVSHWATLLPTGQVLIAGGSGAAFYVGGLSSAELYDPVTGTFTPTGNLTTERLAHKATLLPNGKVLITGGQDSQHRKLAGAELYDPVSGRFSPAGNMTSPRSDHTATLLKDGRVLICGGADAFGDRVEVVISSAEIFDPATGRFTPAGDMSTVRFKHSAILLPDGQVLIIGGSDSRMVRGRRASAEMFDPATGRFTPTGKMHTARYKIRDAVVLLPNGKILVTGGGSRVEVYDPLTGIFGLVAGGIGAEKFYSTATLLANGEVLIVGGYAERQRLSNASAWIYRPEK
jgi:WD40 repeat protein